MKTSLPFLFVVFGSCHAFSTCFQSKVARNLELSATRNAQDRRSFVSAAIIGGASICLTNPALADVSDGNTLPQGAAQFSRLLKVKNDLKVSILALEGVLARANSTSNTSIVHTS